MAPLLRGKLGTEARAALDVLARRFLDVRPSVKQDCSLAAGTAGLAIVHAALDVARPGEGHARASERALDCAIEAMATKQLPPGLYSGFAGVAWAVERLRGDPDARGDEDPLTAIDEALAGFLDHSPWTGPYDVVDGIVGLGVYALERMPRPSAARIVELVVDRLGETAQRRRPGLAWRSRPEWVPPQLVRDPFPAWNLGLAHGTPGVIAFLGCVCAAAPALDPRRARRARALLDGAVEWLLAQRLAGHDGAFASATGPGIERAPARMGWCYGDPGVAASLLVAARGARSKAWERAAIGVARTSVARNPATSGVEDAAFCHGAAGLGHIFHRLHGATGDASFAKAARAWFVRALATRCEARSFGGFRSYVPVGPKAKLAWRPDAGVLNGAGGIALALSAATTDGPSTWDRMFLVTGRGSARDPS